MSDYKLINVNVFNPAFKDVKARCEFLYCNNSENCEYYKQGKCVSEIGALSAVRCPHSKRTHEEGYTQRAKNFYTWQSKRKEKYKDLLNVININNYKLCLCGDYVYLPYPHFKNYVNPLSFIINTYFCKIEEFTVDTIAQILTFKPQALMGGEIKDYQEKIAPKFLQHLKEEMPEKYKEFKVIYSELIDKYKGKEENYIGRKAYIITLKAGAVIKNNENEFIWNGQKLICENYSRAFLPFNVKSAKLELLPTNTDVLEITNNSQVDETTKFKD